MLNKRAVPIVFVSTQVAVIARRTLLDYLICQRFASFTNLEEYLVREFDERPWGRYEVLEERPGFKVKVLEVKPGARLSLQKHARRGEHWVVVQGVADVVCGEQQLQLGRGEHIHIPPQTNHRLGNSGQEPLAIIEVQLGDYLGEDDIVRLEDDYQRIE
ncbi:MAG: phosphomannose isomerase type II C-terminal cupin domain [Acidobacteriota bacterium]